MSASNLMPNCRELADRMVTCEGGYVIVRSPQYSSAPGQESEVRIEAGLAFRDGLRDVLEDLLRAVSDEVQDRFRLVRHTGRGGALAARGNEVLLADDVIGPDLPNAVRSTSKGAGSSDDSSSA